MQQLNNLSENAKIALRLQFQHEEMAKAFAKSKEMQKFKADIIKEVLDSISIEIDNRVEQELDKIFKKYK